MDIPIVDMIVRSGLAARIILILLLLLSVVSWTIVFNRLSFFGTMTKVNKKFRQQFDRLARLGDFAPAGSKGQTVVPLADLARCGADEYRRILAEARAGAGAKDAHVYLQSQFSIAGERLQNAATAITASLDRGVYLLAVVSSIAPFLGLLGTVWGIMNSFYEIGTQGSASLPVVAPGIAEALVVTLAGLVVAIPALFFYNYFSHRADRVEIECGQFKDHLLVQIKQEILADTSVLRRGTL